MLRILCPPAVSQILSRYIEISFRYEEIYLVRCDCTLLSILCMLTNLANDLLVVVSGLKAQNYCKYNKGIQCICRIYI
jgi:hypothetical protein